jgi:hypothetical protein
MEILDKIEKLREVTGNSSLDFTEHDIEDDFDAEQYDKMMKVKIIIFMVCENRQCDNFSFCYIELHV